MDRICPNCGSDILFSKKAKFCKCDDCHKYFKIEKDLKNKTNQIDLKEIKGLSFFLIFFLMFFLIVVSVIVIISINTNNTKENEQLITSTSEIDRKAINNSAKKIIDLNEKNSKKIKETIFLTFTNYYFGTNDKNNILVAIYKVMYEKPYSYDSNCTVYIPVVFENITKKQENIGGKLVEMPIVYLNSNQIDYVKGFSNEERIYIEIVDPLKNNYKIKKVDLS